MALGIAAVLAGGVAPDPLPVQLRGQSIDQAAYFVRAVVRESADAGISLRRVKVDDELFRWFTEPGAEPAGCALVGGGAPAEVLFYRQASQ